MKIEGTMTDFRSDVISEMCDAGRHVSRHFDEIMTDSGWHALSALGGEAFLVRASEIFEHLHNLALHAPRARHSASVAYLPLEDTTDVQRWRPTLLDLLGKRHEPPSFHLCFDSEIFERDDEEYRVRLPELRGIRTRAYFRSYRSLMGTQNEWEFSNGIYLIRDSIYSRHL